MKPSTIRALGAGLLVSALFVGNPARGQGVTPVDAFGITFLNPVCLASPPGETNRLFVLEKHGRVCVITNLANPTRTVFMDISNRVSVVTSDEAGDVGNEEGSVGLAFHPGFATNGFFYVFYTGQATNGTTGLHDILSRFHVSAANPNQGDPKSELRLITQYDQANNHNGGDLHFGPDGYLYVSLGDEGGGNNSYNNAQFIDKNFFSGILRIDVDKQPGNLPPDTNSEFAATTNYAVPSDNPFVGATMFDNAAVNTNGLRTEFWAVGLRNPWRFSFDSVAGTLYCGDVGQDAAEEIDVITKGGNYGWSTFEGTNFTPGVDSNSVPPPQNPQWPIKTILHPLAEAIIGGVVYHGNRLPGLNGAYIYGDYVTGLMSYLVYDGTNVTSSGDLFGDQGISAFGIDPSNGDVLYCNLQNGNNSVIKRIVSAVTGALQVNISPPDAVAAGALWTAAPGTGAWEGSGTIASNLLGIQTISFLNIPGWQTPASFHLTITGGTLTVTNGTYVSMDSAKPTVTITFPKANQNLSNSVLQAQGTAKDNTAVASVWAQLNGGVWTPVTFGTTNWYINIPSLAAGPNTVSAYAKDTSGNISATNSVTFNYVVTSLMTVNTNGQGGVTPTLSGQMLQIGKTYTMTAKPAKGSVFNGWSGDIVTNTPKLIFTMVSDLDVTVNFADISRPVNVITSPKKNLSTTNAEITAAGKASDNVGVTAVYYRLNGGAWNGATPSNGFANWSAPDLALRSGPNQIDAWALDAAANVSLTNSIVFSHKVTASTDWAPDSLSGLIAQAVPESSEPPFSVAFDLVGFSETGSTNSDFDLGGYFYDKLSTNTGVVTLTNTAPPSQSNSYKVLQFTFTNHYMGTFSDQSAHPGSVQLSIAPNLLPSTFTGKKLMATSTNGGGTTMLKFNSNGTVTKTTGGSTATSTGNYTFARYSPVAGLLTIAYTGADVGKFSYMEVTFTSANAGNYFVNDVDGVAAPEVDVGTFVLH